MTKGFPFTAAKSLLKIAWRNVFRNKRRTLLTILTISLGCVGLILIGGYFENIIVGFREQFIHSQTGHLQINAQGYFEKGNSDTFKYTLQNLDRLKNKVESNPHVLFTIPRIKFGGLVNNNNSNVSVMVVGTDPGGEKKLGSLQVDNAKYPSINIAEGSDLDSEDPHGVILGKGLAKSLNLKVGDTFSFITTQSNGALEGDELKVRGIFETIVKDYDDRIMKMDLKTAQKLLQMPNQAHSLVVALNQTERTDEVMSNLSASLQDPSSKYELIPWYEQATFYTQSKKMLDKIFSSVLLIICAIFIFSIANSLNMAVFERIREFGTMLAIGNSRATVFSVIFYEAIFLGILGAIFGISLGVGIAKIVSAIGIEMPPPPQGSYSYHAMITLYPQLLIETFLVAFFSTLISGLIPAYRASHFKIIKALGYV